MKEQNPSNQKPKSNEEEAPAISQKDQAYMTALMKMIHSKQTSGKVVEMLKSAPPEQSVPLTALSVHDTMEKNVAGKGKPPSLETKLMAGVYLVTDLCEIGNSAGIFELTEEDVGPLLQSTMQQYIEKGLKEGSIDPVELQNAVEPLMDEETRNASMDVGDSHGVPRQANQQTAMEGYARGRERKAVDRIANQKAAQNQQKQQQPQQGGQ